MIQVYNVVSGVHDSYSSLQFNMSNVYITRSNKFKMQLTHTHHNLRKHLLTIVIFIWTSYEVVSADTMNMLTSRLDKC